MTDQTSPKPAVTRAAEAIANGWSFLTEAVKALAPSLNNASSLLLAAALGAGGLAGYQKITAPAAVPALTLPAADPPRPTPIARAEEVEHLIGEHVGKIRGDIAALRTLIEERLPAKPSSGSKLRPTKAARVQ